MELKFIGYVEMLTAIISSNRTFMELKFLTIIGLVMKRFVLIVPLWN